MPSLHDQLTDTRTMRHNLTFFIHHGPDTVPEDEPPNPKSEQGHSDRMISLQQSRPVIPPRRSSKSILKYVKTKYTDSASEADYSSLKSSSPVESRQSRGTRQVLTRAPLSGLGQRRAENNDAFRLLEREITSTGRSDVWSFETSSEESIAEKPEVDATTSHEEPPDSLWDRSFSKEANSASPSARKTQSQMASLESPRDEVESLVERRQLEKSQIGGFRANAGWNLPQPSVQSESALQIFENHQADAENQRTGRSDSRVLSKLSSAPPSQSRARQTLDEPFPADLTPEVSAELQPDSVSPQQTVFTQANLINSQTLWSTLSHWSDEFDQFPDSQEITIRRAHSRVYLLRGRDTQGSGPGPTPQLDIQGVNGDSFVEDHERTEIHDESLSTAFEPSTAQTARISSENKLNTHEMAPKASYNAFLHSTESIGDEQAQINEENMTIPIQPSLPAVTRELLPIGVAAQNVQHALGALLLILEPVHQLMFEEQSRAEGLRIAVNENMFLQQELQAAHQAIAERDREIARLRAVVGRMRGQGLPLSTASFHGPSTATQTYSTAPRDEQTQKRFAGQKAVTETFGLAKE